MDKGGKVTLSIVEKIQSCIALQQQIGQHAQKRADQAYAANDLPAYGKWNRKEEASRQILMLMKDQELPYIRDYRGPTLPPKPAA